MGDFNTKVGKDNRGYEKVMGKQGLGVVNENGKRFTNLCANSSLVIGGTIFAHGNIHIATWISPDHSMKNYINHTCISKRFRKRTLSSRKERTWPQIISLKLKLKQNWTKEHCKGIGLTFGY